jgi:hypothetical protein
MLHHLVLRPCIIILYNISFLIRLCLSHSNLNRPTTCTTVSLSLRLNLSLIILASLHTCRVMF